MAMNTDQVRIAFLVDAIRGRNGVGTYYQDLCAQMDGRVARAMLFCPSMQSPDWFQGVSMPLPGDSTQRFFLPKARAISHAIRDFRPNVIVVPVPGPYGMLGFWLARRHGIPLCFAFQTEYERLFELYWKPALARLTVGISRFLHARIFHASSLIVTISRQMQTKARELGVKNPHLVGTPIGPEFVRTPVMPMARDLSRLLFVGRLAREKNLESYLEAAARLPHITFGIAGDGPLRELVHEKQRTLPNIEYHGWVGRDGVVRCLDDVDMLVLPSKVEAFGTVAVEAMARRRLVLTSPHCGVVNWPDLAEALFTIGENEPLHEAIARIAALPFEERQRHADLGRIAALALNNNTIDQWVNLLASVAAPTSRALPRKDDARVA